MGKAAFDNQTIDLRGVMRRQFQHGGTAQRSAHQRQRAVIFVLRKPPADKIENNMAIAHHGRCRGAAGGATVTAIINDQKVDAQLIDDGSEFIVISDNFAIAVKKRTFTPVRSTR